MWHYDRSAGSSSAVMAALTLDNTVGTKNTGFTLTATPVIDTGDVLFGAIQWDFDASADTASTDINYLRLEFQEGRA